MRNRRRLTHAPRFAVVGCGRMGAERAKQIAAVGAVVAICVDEDPLRSEALAACHAGATALDRKERIEWATVDGVFVCTPPAVRGDVVRCAVDAGVAIFIEKPLGINAREALGVVNSIDRSRCVAAVGYMNRYRPGVIEARRVGESGIVALTCHWFARRYNVPWWADESLSGGPFNEQATHLVDLCRYIGGEVKEVRAIRAHDGDTLGAVLSFETGAIGTLLYSCEAHEKDIGLRLLTRAGSLALEGWDFQPSEMPLMKGTIATDADPFAAEVKAFILAIVDNDRSQIRCTAFDAYRTQLLVDRILGDVR